MKKEEKVIMNQALMMAKAALKTAIDVLEEERDENCLSAKIRSTDEANEIAGVLYQLFPQKKLVDIWEWVGEYCGIRVKTGNWKQEGIFKYKCDQCGGNSPEEFPYCPHCGAMMSESLKTVALLGNPLKLGLTVGLIQEDEDL